MKKIVGFLMIALLALMALPAKAQLKFGIKGGVNISSVHFNSDVLKADNVTGFQVGPMIETTLPLVGVGIDAAVLYSQKGMETDEMSGIKTSMKTDYIDIPVNLKWKFGLPIVKAYLAAGPYIGFRVGGDKIWDVLGDQIEAKSFSAGLNFGAGVELISHLQVGINYGLGLTDNYSAKKIDLEGKNRGWSITAAILF
ncbi:porin family protein [Parabacteroides sp.]